MQFSQSLGHQQFQGRQLATGHVQHGIGQGQLNQGNQLNRHLSQFSGTANSALFSAAQGTPNPQMVRYFSGVDFSFFLFLKKSSYVIYSVVIIPLLYVLHFVNCNACRFIWL